MNNVNKSIQNARQRAELLLQEVKIKRVPVSLTKISKNLNISIEYAPLDRELSGMALTKSEEKLIWINSLHHPNRQRFTLAHEIGHHVLHQDILIAGVHVDKGILRRDTVSSAGSDIKEIEANAFASQLLMPNNEIHKLSKDLDLDDDDAIRSLANKFKVSVAALQYRLVKI